MKDMQKIIEFGIPFIRAYPQWVRLAFAFWIIATAIMVIILIFTKSNSANEDNINIPDTSRHSFNASGANIVQVGGDVTINNRQANDGTIEIVQTRFNDKGQLDILFRNTGDNACVITKISATVISDTGYHARYALDPSGKYILKTKNMKIGDTTSIAISQVVQPRNADRILIQFDSPRVLNMRFIIIYNGNKQVTFEKQIWVVDG